MGWKEGRYPRCGCDAYHLNEKAEALRGAQRELCVNDEIARMRYQHAVGEGIPPQEICAEMRRRADRLGIAEKLPKPSRLS